MPTPIADAFVRLRPDVSGFRAEVAATVGTTLASLGTSVASAGGITAHTKALEGATAAGLTAAGAERAYAAALSQGGVVLGAATVANDALAASQTRVAESAAAAGFFSRFRLAGLREAADESNLARGALIGLSRITPVAVFGLGVVGTAAIAVGLGLRAAIKDAAQFEQSMNVLQAVTEATGEQMRAVQEEAQRLGKDISLPGVSANDAAIAMTELSKAGLTVEESMAAAEGVLQLATAATISAGDAAKITASALNAFALSGDQATHVADLLAASSIAAQGEITDMGAALQQVSAVAHQANISVDDTVAAITLLAQHGLLGSDAGTSLRTTLLRLVPTTKEAALFQKALGVETTTTTGEIKDLAQVAEEYRRALQGLAEDQQQAALQQIFGQDAIRAATILADEGAEGFNKAREATERQGAAADIAAAKAEGLAGAWAGLSSNADTLATNIGLLVTPILTEFVTTISDAIGLVNDFVTALEKIGDVDIPEIKLSVGDIPGVPDVPDVTPGFSLGGFNIREEVEGIFKDTAERLNPFGPLNSSLETARGLYETLKAPVVFIKDNTALTAFHWGQVEESLSEADRRAAGLGATIKGIVSVPDSTLFGALELPDTTGPPDAREVEQHAKTLETQIRRQIGLLNNLGAAAFEQEGESFRTKLQEQIDGLIQMGFIAGKQLAAISRQALPILTRSLRIDVQQIVPDLEVEPILSDELKSQITRVAALPGGTAELEQLGKDIVGAIGDGMEQSDRMVEAAEKQLEDAVAGMQDAIRDSVRSARENLEGLAQSLASQVGEVIDKMDFGVPALQRQTIRIELQTDVRQAEQALADARQRGLSGAALDPFIANVTDAQKTLTNFANTGRASVETLQSALEGLERRLQRRQLVFSLTEANRELRDAREEIANISSVGFQTPAQQQAVRETLDPFVESVAQAQGAVRTFDLSGQIAALEEITEKAKKAATEGITKLVADFQEGRTSASQFESQLRSRLGPALDQLHKKSGTNLGLSFTQNFLRTFESLVTQARLLTGFLDVLGTTPGNQPIDPNKVKSEQQRKVAEAQRNLTESIKNSKKTADNTTAQVKLLGFILAVLQDQTPARLTKPEFQRGIAQAERLTGVDIG